MILLLANTRKGMFQMTAVALQTHLKPMSKVVNHPDTLFFSDGMNLLGDGHFKFGNGLRIIFIHVVLQEPRDKKSEGFRSGEYGNHLGSQRLLIRESVVQPLHRDVDCM